MSAKAEVRFELLEAERATPALTPAPDGLGRLPRGNLVARITIESVLAGKKTIEDVWLDPADGAALERRKAQGGGKPYTRTERFTPAGVHGERRAPKNDREAAKEPSRWSDRQAGFEAFPSISGQAPVTHASALFYLVSAAPLEAPGDRFETMIFTRGQMIPVTLDVVGTEAVEVAFDEASGERVEPRTGSVEALRIRISSAGGEGSEVRLLGLKRDIEILVDKTDRVPVLVRGSIGFVGRVSVKLTRVVKR